MQTRTGHSPLRTLVVLHSDAAAGPPEHVFAWLAALAERGPLTTVVPAPGSAADLYATIGATTALGFQRVTYPGRLGAIGPHAVRFAADVRNFGRVMRRVDPDLVVGVTAAVPAALVAARMQRAAIVVFVGELFDKGFETSRGRALGAAAVVRMTAATADGIIGCSEAVTRQFAGAHPRLLKTIYPGIGSSYAQGDGARFRERHGLDDAEPCLAVIGNVTPGRGQDLVIRALPELRKEFPAIHCVFAGVPHPLPGDRAYRDEIEALARRLGVDDRVVFAGLVDPIADLYAATDVVVNPARFNEPFGRVAVEALSAGCPVVAARVGAIPEVVRDERDALLFEAGDSDALRAAVGRLWRDGGLRRELVRSGRSRVATMFREDVAVEAFAAIVDRVLETRGADGARASP